ncbi:MAG: NUDIX domain-containing protein [Bdellovibrionales bacterium]
MEKIIKELKLARGLLFRNNQILLVKDIRPNQGHYFLPGGSVELGEAVRISLVREWKEELGWVVVVGSFFGCLEHSWNFNRKSDNALVDVVEVNYLFNISVENKYLEIEPQSKEDHLSFSWVNLSDLPSLNLLPAPLKSIIPKIKENSLRAIWESTL